MPPPAAQKILAMEIAGLGDNVHSLPALWLLRQNHPQAQLQVLAASGSADLFKLAPWVDKIWAYPWNPRPNFSEHLRWGLKLRREQFDLVINFSGSDRSTLLARMSGARERWGRRPHDGGMRGFGLFYTRVLEHPFYTEPMALQKWRMLCQQGYAGSDAPEFHVEINPLWRRQAGIDVAAEGRYFHVSPCASSPHKELPPAQMARLLEQLHAEFPQYPLAISCSPAPREKLLLESLLAKLSFTPWKVFAGTLDVPRLAAVIQGGSLHLCGDTGSFHLAQMTQRPSVVWYRQHGGESEWVPRDGSCRVLYSDQGDTTQLLGIDNASLIAAARELLAR
jgi:heptosyltransferase-1/heptosyltransferase-2